MSYDLEATVFRKREALCHCLNRVSTIGITSNVLKDALYSDFEPRASVCKHIIQVRLETIVRSGLNCDTDSFCLALLAKQDCFLNSR